MGFVAHEVAVEIVKEMGPIVRLVRQHDASLGKQMAEATQSILLNIGEGMRRRKGDRLHHYDIAAGSTGETEDALTVAVAWGYVAESRTVKVLALIDRELRLLWGLTHPRA